MKIYKFQATWCNPCKMLSKTLENVGLNGHELVEVDIDENAELTKQYNIRGVPALVMVDDEGKEVRRLVGAQNETKLKGWLE
jgi:thioredoxin 1